MINLPYNESNSRPEAFSVERNADGSADIVFAENINEFMQDDEVMYRWEEYRLTVPYRDNLYENVQNNEPAWLEKAKQKKYDDAAAEVRAVRDSLLKQSDKQVILDRIALDTTDAASLAQSFAGVLTGEWAIYRQALRNVPQQEGFPFDVIFPEKPENEISSGN